jgi:cellulose biosynthesis protein BcsQ
MEYKELSIRDRINQFTSMGKHPVNLLPNEEVVKDIFIELEDEEFVIDILTDKNKQVESDDIKYFEMVFDTIIHRNTRLSEAPSVGKPVILFDAESKGTVNYLNLTKEILQKNGMTKISNEERIIE